MPVRWTSPAAEALERIVDDTVEIVSVFHTSRRFPPEL